MAEKLHVVMLPWIAFGHMIPFFQLSIALAKAGIKVSFVSTPRNIKRLPEIPPGLADLVEFVEFPLPSLENDVLPDDGEATVDIPAEKMEYLKIAYDLLKHPLKQFIADQLPDWIIIDMMPYWMVDIARENKVPLIHFTIFGAAANVFLGHPERLVGDGQEKLSLTSKPEWVDFASSVAYRNDEVAGVFEGIYGENASGVTDVERVSRIQNGCQALVVRSCAEFEGDYLNIFERLTGKPVIPIGVLPREKPERKQLTDGRWGEMFKWLDDQKPKSVVFVGFGSECKLTKDQVYEIAHGLELSGLPFLWALRKPGWANDDRDALPSGFGERTSDKGIVCTGWVPQLEILGHPSVGGSFIHCGWGSINESLQFGHALILLPFNLDQPLNARFLVEKGLGVEIERGEDGSFTRDGVEKALKLAMVSAEGKSLREKASEAGVLFGNLKLHQDYYIAKFVDFLKKKKRNV